MGADNAGLAADVQWSQAYQSSTLTRYFPCFVMRSPAIMAISCPCRRRRTRFDCWRAV